MKKNKIQLLRSKIVRTLQLLLLAKQKGYIDNEDYQNTTRKYKKKFQELQDNSEDHQQENYFKGIPMPDYIAKEQVAGQSKKNASYDILGGLGLKILLLLTTFVAIAVFLPHVIALSTNKPVYLLIAIGAPVLYLCIVYLLDKYEPEPKMFVIGAFLWGAVSTVLALFMNVALASTVGLSLSICLAGVTEELAKGLGLFRLSKHPEYNDTLDAIVYGFAVGLGFAAVENIFYYYQFMNSADKAGRLLGDVATMIAIRASLCALGHAVFTTTIAIVLAQAKQVKGMPTMGDFIKGYTIAAFIHGMFNYFCITLGNTSIIANSVVVLVGLFIFWSIIKQNWAQVRNWGWHLEVKS